MIAPAEALRLFLPLAQAEGLPIAAEREPQGAPEFIQLPATGGSFLLLSTQSGASFRAGLEGLTLSRPIWKFGRFVLRTLSRVGAHRWIGLRRVRAELPASQGTQIIDFSMQSGVPGGGQKLIVREHGPTGEALSFWKLGVSGLPAKLVRAESEALAWLDARGLGGVLAPTLICHGSDQQKAWLRMSALVGEPGGNASSAQRDEFIQRLRENSTKRMRPAESRWFKELTQRLERVKARAPELPTLAERTLHSIRGLGDQELDFHAMHGDFTPWNTLLAHGRLKAFDWEFFGPEAPAHFDSIHWMMQQGVLVERQASAALGSRALDWLRSTGLDSAQARLRLALYLIWAMARDEEIFLHGEPEFEQVEWLRSCRSELLASIQEG